MCKRFFVLEIRFFRSYGDETQRLASVCLKSFRWFFLMRPEPVIHERKIITTRRGVQGALRMRRGLRPQRPTQDSHRAVHAKRTNLFFSFLLGISRTGDGTAGEIQQKRKKRVHAKRVFCANGFSFLKHAFFEATETKPSG